jgi:hypothetical protein
MRRLAPPLTLALLLHLCGATTANASHSAYAWLASDPSSGLFFSGTSNPSGPPQISVVGGAPGYLNSVTGGSATQSIGGASITQFAFGQTELVALALHVSDSAGPSHSLSSLNDPELATVVADINAVSLTAYAYNAAPANLAPLQSLLTAGEITNGGQPFDILLVTNNTLGTGRGPRLELNFATEASQINDITSISVTDIGAIPEPSALLCLLAPMLLLPRRRS